MSWQSYVDTNLVGTGNVTQAAIIGLKGGVWASSSGFTLTAEEQSALIAGFDDASKLLEAGIFIAGKKYFTLSANDRSIYGKAGADGLVCVKTNQAVLICRYTSPIVPGQATKTVEDLGDYLINQGY
ncbi:putative PFY1-profilin [Acaromyces ingoldii]|uniref:Profilin n=1 Tax=Acaromyces ingoldii TaxID=215250 RepID=A0A316YZC5_9BASI|nr:putative PFY1-profilin [Acaromyces ingoldii]PWN93403.1 putative PFY1-profilin [Acaromyces ingoldii]